MNKKILMRASTALDWTLLTIFYFRSIIMIGKLILQFFSFQVCFQSHSNLKVKPVYNGHPWELMAR